MTHSSDSTTHSRRECHITDLFFRSELAQMAGSDAGDKWFREHSRGAVLNRCNRLALHSPLSADSSPKSPPPGLSHRSAETDSPKSACKLPNQEFPNLSSLPMDEDELPFHLKSSKLFQDCGVDIGLLFTDAAYTVLTHLGSHKTH
jgi:hypothetical protein